MGCCGRRTVRQIKSEPRTPLTKEAIRKPNVSIELADSVKKQLYIKAFIQVARCCADANRYVDHILSWIHTEGIRTEKLDINSPDGLKNGIKNAPYYQVFYQRKATGIIYGRGIAVTYTELVNYLNGLKFTGS